MPEPHDRFYTTSRDVTSALHFKCGKTCTRKD